MIHAPRRTGEVVVPFAVTFKTMFTKPVTESYPEEKVPPQPRVPFKIVPSPTLKPPTEPPAKAKPAPTEPEERSLAQPGQATMSFDC